MAALSPHLRVVCASALADVPTRNRDSELFVRSQHRLLSMEQKLPMVRLTSISESMEKATEAV